ncbi:MAG TPA: type I phosphomannose isomerase catalytic subunit [Candidatus Baltobacteraceae bacterium]|jgi:mannose-6-phosphate isomerase|nr:type I phosphomannose isomerase catalytic subunit [Candidatus Baltobacteraceae bacterium]
MKLYPLTFDPIFKERIWGGRNLETLYGKPLPPGLRIGESWEICDRPNDQSVVANGPLRGRTLHWLITECPEALLGPRRPMPPRFPLLIKIIDAQETLSLQVHPPAGLAAELGGEPKTEMWYVARAEPKAELFVGLKSGVTRARFEQERISQTVAGCFHRIKVKAGDAMFLPSGRVHALGGGTVIFEIQQNSDTTYRVFDWNRLDGDGKARELHVAQSLASIDFNDFEPGLLPQSTLDAVPGTIRPLVKNELFEVAVRKLPGGERMNLTDGGMQVIGVVEGVVWIETAEENITLQAGGFCLVPAQGVEAILGTEGGASFLQVC